MTRSMRWGCFPPLLLAIFLTACTPQLSGPRKMPGSPPPIPGYVSTATYYAKHFNGRRTITGERYDPNLLTAATHDLPLGTRARVINPKNGREVTVRVNDRPRKRKFPLIDLSRAAAKELDFLDEGKISVKVIPLPPEAPEDSSGGKKKRRNPPAGAPRV